MSFVLEAHMSDGSVHRESFQSMIDAQTRKEIMNRDWRDRVEFERGRPKIKVFMESDSPIPLWMICFADDDGNNFDLFVAAASSDQAIALWKAYYYFEGDWLRGRKLRIFLVPDREISQAHAISWGAIDIETVTL